MKPEKWGPIIWYLLHIITYYIPNDEYFNKYKVYYYLFFITLKKIIPCPVCRGHYNQLLNENDITKCKNKDDIIEWCINAHNEVNKRLSKQLLIREQINELYTNNIDLKKFIKSIDILTFNFQYRFPINYYRDFFNSLRFVFPIEKIRILYQKGMAENSIKVRTHRDLINWYMQLGEYISSNLNNEQ